MLDGAPGDRYRLRPSPPQPEPFTTIAWRLAHVIVGVLAARSHHHFGGPPADYRSWPYATDADTALVQLDDAYHHWITGVRTSPTRASTGPAAPPKACTPSIRWPNWSCTSTVR